MCNSLTTVFGSCSTVSSCETASWKFGSKGLISTVEGTKPFYTNATSNPWNISLSEGESREVVFWVNATGEEDTTWEFFAYANLTSDLSMGNMTRWWNVTIGEIPYLELLISTELEEGIKLAISR